VPFTNAYIRGMDKLITAARGTTGAYGMSRAEAKAMFRNRMLTLGAIGFTYALMMAGDDEYEKLDDSIRDTHFVFPSLKIGDSPVGVPLPRDLAFIFKAIPERIVNYVRKYGTPEEQSGIRVIGELLKQGAGTIAAPNVTPTVLLPLLENITNYSAFLGRPLESQSQQTRESFLASGRGTSEVSKGLSKGLSAVSKGFGDVGLGSIGSMFEVSPVKLENLFRGLLGTSGALLLAMGDEILAPERADKTTARSVLAQLTGASALMVDPVGRKQLNEFFDLYEKLDKVGSSLKYLEEKDPEEAVKYAREHEAELNVLDEAKIIYQNIQVLNKDAQEVDLDKSMSGKQKLQAISKIVRDQNLTARKVDEIKSYLDKHK